MRTIFRGNIILIISTLALLSSCDNSQWETIRGNGINHDPKTIDKAIYFENENRGLVGGYTLVKDKNDTVDGLLLTPALFLTEDGGKNWNEIKLNSSIRASVDNVFLHHDTIICQLDAEILFSTDRGKTFQRLNNSLEKQLIADHHFNTNRYDIEDHDFLFKDKKYRINERYKNDFAIVIVCSGEKTLIDYYFVSYDKGITWKYLQNLYGDNKARYLLHDKFLYCYDFQFGLQRLKLK